MHSTILTSGIIATLASTIKEMGWNGRVIVVFTTIAAVLITYYACKKIVIPAITRLVIRTSFSWDDILLCPRVLNSISKIIPATMLLPVLPYTFYDAPITLNIAVKLCEVYIIGTLVQLILNILDSIYRLAESNSAMRNRPLKGIHQMLQVVTIAIGIILTVSSLFDKSPLELLVGLSAAATVLMLIFKDSIVGLVAGVQLSANDMLRPGDWIVVPDSNADGVVFEVGLTTVKVRNWDNTISTVPPYTLVSGSFVNWRGMEEGQGRRINRSIIIDMMSIDFCNDDEIIKYKAEGLIAQNEDASTITNSTILRRHLLMYLKQHPGVNKEMTLMVRQLQPHEEGLPLEMYCFSKDKSWENYEELQSDITDYAIAIAPRFGLKVFQRASAPLAERQSRQ